jgi:hypothetical protein
MIITGTVVEMGDLEDSAGRGFLIEKTSPSYFIAVTGFSQTEMSEMPNLLYKKVKLTLEFEDETN